MQIFCGGLDQNVTEEELKLAFEQFGPVQRVKICTHKATGRSRGFGFISMRPSGGGREAIAALNGSIIGSRRVSVEESNL